MALTGVLNQALTFDGVSATVATSKTFYNPQGFTLSSWVNTTTLTGGRIIGSGDAASGGSNNYDRQIYIDNAGHIYFDVWTGSAKTVSSSTYNDGRWHHVVGVATTGGFISLYVDGALVGGPYNSGVPTVANTCYWRIGGDHIGGSWPGFPISARSPIARTIPLHSR